MTTSTTPATAPRKLNCKRLKKDPRDLKVNFNLNVRDVNNYDVAEMKESILEIGKILKAIGVNGDTGEALYGNRRLLAAQELLADPNTPSGVADELKKIDVDWYTDLTPEDVENLVFDHGKEKPLDRSEVLQAVWRLFQAGRSQGEIAIKMCYVLADFTGKTRKIKDLQKLSEQERNKAIKAHFNGTLGKYMLDVFKMGEEVREQVLLNYRRDDGLATDEELKKIKWQFRTARIDALAKIKGELERAKEWNPTEYPERFRQLLTQFETEDNGPKNPKPKTRPTSNDIEVRLPNFKSEALKGALGWANGKDGIDLIKLDEKTTRNELVRDILLKWSPELEHGPLYELIGLVLHSHPDKLEEYLEQQAELLKNQNGQTVP